MTEDLKALKDALNLATPNPDPETRAAHMALATRNFADLHEPEDEVRHSTMPPSTGLLRGASDLFHALTSRSALTMTTAIVAVGIVFLSPIGDDLLTPPSPTSLVNKEGVKPADQPAISADRSPLELPSEPSTADLRETLELFLEPEALRIGDLQDHLSARVQLQEAEEGFNSLVVPLSPDDASAPLAVVDPSALKLEMAEPRGPLVEQDDEVFANKDTSPLRITTEEPVSTFSIDVDTASYAIVRNSLQQGVLPVKEAVRIEEMINYFDYGYAAPEGEIPFRPNVSVIPTPWNDGTQLVHIGIQGRLPALEDRPPLNLVFLVDTSGSMQAANKLPLLKQSLRLMLGRLRAEDEVAIVAYAGRAGEVLDPTPASDSSRILEALDRLEAGGSTAGETGLEQAYRVADSMSQSGEVTRVILATDGDFNVGIRDPEQLTDLIAEKRDTGTYLSVLGFGRGNLDDATMQALAQNGNGQAAYIDTLNEAQKVLVDQFAGALFPIANDVKIQVEFNPAQVAEYRLIGYETRALRREDFNNDRVDAGDIGAGHAVTALYEITPVGSPARLSDPLRYMNFAVPDTGDELGFLRIRYKLPETTTSRLLETPITAGVTLAHESGFAAAIAGFGQLLRRGEYLGDWTYRDAIALAHETRGADSYGYKSEAIQLMRLAESLSNK